RVCVRVRVPVMPGLLFLAAYASRDTSVEVWASVGDTVILPCQLDLAGENDPSVEWSKNMSIAFRYRAGCETFEEKDPVFSYRTSLFMEELKDGNVSLRLSDVRLSDAGTYKCRKWRAPQDTIVLFVGAVSEPKLSLVQGVAVTVQCEAACWSPLPVVTFQDAQGNDGSHRRHASRSRTGHLRQSPRGRSSYWTQTQTPRPLCPKLPSWPVSFPHPPPCQPHCPSTRHPPPAHIFPS
uniref:Ig-like domain-containing protein n=1 Tax=Cyclopterus lumpus TaxID=8103 RepID=A0A8C3AEY9_CYCLU